MWSNNEEPEDDEYNFEYSYPANVTIRNLILQNAPSTASIVQPSVIPSSRRGTAPRTTTTGRTLTGTAVGPNGEPSRPLTSIGSAKYRVAPGTARTLIKLQLIFNEEHNKGPVLQKKLDDSSAEAQARAMEKKLHASIDDTALLFDRNDPKGALEKAKEAAKREAKLAKFREENNIGEAANFDLTYAIYFNLGNAYHKNKLFNEAIEAYNKIVKNRQYAQGGRMRANMGNVYYDQKKFSLAIKQYQMAMDQIPNTAKEMRNIGNCYVAMGKYDEAAQSFEAVLETINDVRSAINLVVCYFMLNNREKTKSGFSSLLNLRKAALDPLHSDEPGAVTAPQDDDEENQANDILRHENRNRQKYVDRVIIMASKLIAPMIEKDFSTGYDYIVETLRNSKNEDLADELEISKALTYMKKRDIPRAIHTLKEFERKDREMASAAATNLSFLYFLEKDYKAAENYAVRALKSDQYNAKALVNKGNCLYVRKKYEEAKAKYEEAAQCEAECVEAIYNLGLVHKELGSYEKALDNFSKLQAMIPNDTQVLYQLASIYQKINNLKEAEIKYKVLLTKAPSDPAILQRMGALYAQQGDDMMAHQYYMESYRYYPADLNVLSWLGAYYVKAEVYEKAVTYFQRASHLQPNEVKWLLMIASCYRRLRAFQQAYEVYLEVHKKEPQNVECLRYLIQICNDLGMKDQVNEFVKKLGKAEQNAWGKEPKDAGDSIMMSPKPGRGAEPIPSLAAKPAEREWDSSVLQRPTTSGPRKKITAEEDFGEGFNDELLPL